MTNSVIKPHQILIFYFQKRENNESPTSQILLYILKRIIKEADGFCIQIRIEWSTEEEVRMLKDQKHRAENSMN